jgi:hypothetical protein
VLYIATGANYVKEAEASARSVRKWMPELPMALWTDDPSRVTKELFSEIHKIENPTFSFRDRFKPLRETPYARTLALDTDTLLIGAVPELFEILDQYDFAACHGPVRGTHSPELMADCPLAFVELNVGVMAYNRKPEIIELFNRWQARHEQQLREFPHRISIQPPLRRVLWESGMKFLTLPPEYNERTPYPVFSGRMPVKILHGRGLTLARAVEKINLHTDRIRVFDFSKETMRDRINRLLGRGPQAAQT